MSDDAPLVLAVPSKGRLQENATAFFGRAGLSFVQSRGARDYRAGIAGLEGAEVAFLSASEIVAQLASGAAHLGITGEDLVREQVADADAVMAMLTPLGFGQANVVVAVPQAWIDVRCMADLDDVAATMRARTGAKLRVATKYVNLTRRFFAAHGLADYRIVESLGATEGAPAAGSAEIIVDITTTGATLAANALKTLDDGVLLASEANLVASLRAPWGARARATAQAILSRIAAEEEARSVREVRARIALTPETAAEIQELFGARLPFGEAGEGAVLTIHCPQKTVFGLVEHLAQAGADDITVAAPAYVFRRTNPLIERLSARI